MSNLERLSMMKICSTDNKDVPIKIETNEELRFAISLVANRSDKNIKLSILFDEQDKNVLYDAFKHADVEKNITDFLAESDAKISILTNNKEKIKLSGIYQDKNKKKIEILSLNKKMVDLLEGKSSRPHTLKNFMIGDDESLLVGSFIFDESSKPTFVNFYDKKNSLIMNDYYAYIKDFVLNGGEFKK